MGKYKRLAPWQEINYFNTPVWTQYAPQSTGTWYAATGPNVNRIAIIFSSPNGCLVSTSNKLTIPGGITVPSASLPVILTEKDVGPLVAQQWYVAGNTAGAQLTVCEIILRDWPEDNP